MNTQFSYLSSAELTDVGRRRKNNEDSLVSLPESGVFCVADGMGGVQGGEVASKAAVDAIRKAFQESPDAAFAVTADASIKLIERALNEASRWIKERAEGLGISGTGSTAVALAFDRVTPSQGVAVHAGDSRAYRFRDDKLAQLTTDHSVAAAAGLPDDSSLPPMFRGVITRAVGLDRHVVLEATPFDVVAGDIFLLCSDGLSKMVSDRRIQKLIRKHRTDSLEEMAKSLIAEALEEGGEDNVTVIVVRVAEELPKGPTMEIPPETLALEQLMLVEPVADGPQHSHDDHDETGQTANTAGAATASTMADSDTPSDRNKMPSDGVVGSTPTTPVSGYGGENTPDTPGRSAPPLRMAASASSRSMAWFWILFCLVILTGIGAWVVLKSQVLSPNTKSHSFGFDVMAPAAPAKGATPPPEAGVNEHPAAATESHGGTTE
ncbi:MAG: protein phosphatase 2C domain-containing protein [bacterium]